MTKLPCTIEACENQSHARGLCASHYVADPARLCKVEQCDRPVRTRGWCISHYQRWHRSGDPLPPTAPDPLDLYWQRVDRSGGPDACWPWTGSRDKNGYGVFCTGGRHYLATRWGYEHRIGPIPEGQGILHHCDNPPCQNDRHWFTGTQAANNADKMRKGRQRNARGIHQHNAKLDDELVRDIRARYAAGGVRQADLAAEYGVTQPTIGRLVRRENWKHVA